MSKRNRVGWGLAAVATVLAPYLMIAIGAGYIVYALLTEEEKEEGSNNKE